MSTYHEIRILYEALAIKFKETRSMSNNSEFVLKFDRRNELVSLIPFCCD